MQYVEIRGYRIAVHAKTGAQLNWYRDNYARRSDIVLAGLAAETSLQEHESGQQIACKGRELAAIHRRAQFHIVA